MENYIRKTKIICTIGPASGNEEVLEKLALAGMNVARFNFSHSDYDVFEKWLNNIEKVRDKLDLPIATMLDTKGPEIRTGNFDNPQGVEVKEGDSYTLTTDDVIGNNNICSLSYKGIIENIQPGMDILIDDGLISLKVESVSNDDIHCIVVDGGTISAHKGVNFPGVKITMPYLSERDMSDLKFGAEHDFDFIAASFCRTAADIVYLRNFCHALGWDKVKIIAKIENSEGIDNLDDIIKEADGIMIARGDMGVEIDFEKIPALQKMIINKVYSAGKVVVTATQMLESMITSPRPTRAEITDVANAVYDGTSAIMLSGETAMGMHPVEAVEVMDSIAKTTEQDIDYKERFLFHTPRRSHGDITSAISHATVTTALDLNAKAIITVTKSGNTAQQVSKYRPECPIISATMSEKVRRQNNLSWGIIPVMCTEKNNTDELFQHALEVSKKTGLLCDGDVVVLTAGIPLGQSGTTNMLKVERIHDNEPTIK